MSKVVTITFCDRAENHVGMQMLGEKAEGGFSIEELQAVKAESTELINLNEFLPTNVNADPAAVLIIRGAVKNPDELLAEQLALRWDTKARMRGKVVNKHARHNLCYGWEAQEPDYENGKGRIVPFTELPHLNAVRKSLSKLLGPKADELVAEGNLYFDVNKCGIGFHGDAERRRVVGLRLGASMPLHYQWHLRSTPIGARVKLMLNHGDMYIMSDKAVGTDWMKKVVPTLRHAAGCPKFLTTTKPSGSKSTGGSKEAKGAKRVVSTTVKTPPASCSKKEEDDDDDDSHRNKKAKS